MRFVEIRTWGTWEPGDNHQRFRVQKMRRHETIRSCLFSKKHTRLSDRDQGHTSIGSLLSILRNLTPL